MISRYEFEILAYVERCGSAADSVRETANELCLSWSAVETAIDRLKSLSCLISDGERLSLTEDGLAALSPFQVRRAVILAAGFGSRMMPATAERPKPMVEVAGVRIIDTLLDALVGAGIREITIIGGYRFETLKELLVKYPFLHLIENTDYASANNISSAVLARDALHGGCYLCEADLLIANPRIITKYQYASNILGSYSMETDDWSFKMVDGCVADYRKGNTYCYNYYGISFWSAEDCEKLNRDFAEVYARPDGKDYFWEFVPFVLKKENYQVEIRPCSKRDIVEIDNYSELAQLDGRYREKEEDKP
ncbi:MAG: phosphocholine cytidylyltransferase family protein [Oscillospiraceae bacterium]|nr:phosphocholine cytidylyltransferase family protein [Oscillospiraceae bacterium]